MCVINKFEKISYAQYCKDVEDVFSVEKEYNDIKLPRRGTKGSSGYDIFSPIYFKLEPGETIKLPTGIKCYIKDRQFLMIVPRSSLGFKYRTQLDNTVGIIDLDYVDNPNNSGHMFLKITNDSRDGKTLVVNKGDAIAQAIFLKFDITIDDDADGERQGGLGSTDNK